MIIYRKATGLRIKRWIWPEPPWWTATAIAPYGTRRANPVAVDYLDLRATSSERLEVAVAENVRDHLERLSSRVTGPVLVDAAEGAEVVFQRGEETMTVLAEWNVPATALISTRSRIPQAAAEMIVVAAWPLEFDRIEAHAAALQSRAWGMAVPVIFPVTTQLTAVDRLCDIAAKHGAKFFAAIPLEINATAKQAIARSLTLPDDEETYQQLFHSDLEPLHVATERHIAALAAAAGMADFVVPPRWIEKTNWNAAILLTLTATRMLAMESNTELAGTIARSARLVAALEKPLARVAEAASLSIVENLDEVSVDILNDWISDGRSAFVEKVNERWRLRRDAGL